MIAIIWKALGASIAMSSRSSAIGENPSSKAEIEHNFFSAALVNPSATSFPSTSFDSIALETSLGDKPVD